MSILPGGPPEVSSTAGLTAAKGFRVWLTGVGIQEFDGSTWASPSGSSDGLGSDGDKGDVAVGGGGTTLIINAGAVTLAKQADVASARIMGRVTAGAGVQEALTGAQATTLIDAMVGDSGAGGTKGAVPAPAAGDAAAGKFLKADGTWAAPAGGSGLTHPQVLARSLGA